RASPPAATRPRAASRGGRGGAELRGAGFPRPAAGNSGRPSACPTALETAATSRSARGRVLRRQAADQVGHEGGVALGEGVGAGFGGGGDRGGVGVDRGGAGRGDEEEEQAAGVEIGVEFAG